MTDNSARFALPYLQPGQAQKEMFHNEALALLDLAVHATVQSIGLATPPLSPAPGQCWIVSAPPSGAWAGQAGMIAGWTSGGWRFVRPAEGMMAWSVADALWVQWRDGSWILGEMHVRALRIGGVQVVGPRAAPIQDPSGGTTVDGEARAAIMQIAATMRSHGLIAG